MRTVALAVVLLALLVVAGVDRRHGCREDETWVALGAGGLCVHVP